jgi:hypothetical protein
MHPIHQTLSVRTPPDHDHFRGPALVLLLPPSSLEPLLRDLYRILIPKYLYFISPGTSDHDDPLILTASIILVLVHAILHVLVLVHAILHEFWYSFECLYAYLPQYDPFDSFLSLPSYWSLSGRGR